VILEEIKIDEDNPDVLVHELSRKPSGGPSARLAYSRTSKTGSKLDRTNLVVYHSDASWRQHHLFAAANLDPTSFGEAAAGSSHAGGGATLNELPAPEAAARIVLRNKKSLEQCRFAWAFPRRPSPTRTATPRSSLNTSWARHELGGSSDHRESGAMPIRSTSDLSPYRRHRNPAGL